MSEIVCPSCQAVNSETAKFCQSCGASFSEPAKPKSKRKIVLIGAGGLLGLCVMCAVFVALIDSTPSVRPTRTIQPVVARLDLPTDTQAPTLTPEPTQTQAPTPTPIMVCRDIEWARSNMTDIQWDQYTQDLVNETIEFTGSVIEVHSDGRVQIDGCKNLMSYMILYGLPRDVVAKLDKRQSVRGIGSVREVSIFLGMSVSIDVTELYD